MTAKSKGKRPVAMTVAGSDPSGGAGIQQDMRVFTCLGIHACACPTAITVQNTMGVQEVHPLPGALVRRQMEAVLEDIEVAGLKIGMLANEEIVEAVSMALGRRDAGWVVADPVMRSKNGAVLLRHEAWEAYERMLLPYVDVLTPNLQEASAILSRRIGSLEDMKEAATALFHIVSKVRGTGDRCGVYLKGGHLQDMESSIDVLCYQGRIMLLEGRRVENVHTHGTGCTLSSALCGYLAQGLEMEEAARCAKEFVTAAIEAGFALGKGTGPVDPLVFLKI